MSEQHLTGSTRASDADRATAAERLSTALSEGRLDFAEYERRSQRAFAATTLGELVPLTADLPVPTVDAAVAKREADKREYLSEWVDWAFGAAVMTGIWGLTSYFQGELKFFWPAVPLGIWALVLLSYLFRDDD